MQVNGRHSIKSTSKAKKATLKRFITGGVAILAIFLLGVGVGNGSVGLRPDTIFQRAHNNNLPSQLDYGSVDQVYDAIRRHYDGELTEEQLLDGLKKGLARATGDVHTEYLNAEDAKAFEEGLSGTFSGIGAELGKRDNNVVIVAPLAGYPAEKAGLRPQDVIAEINGESAYDISVTEAVRKIRGQEGTIVKLKIIRNESQELELEITRSQISIPSVESEVLQGNVGYLKISRFSEDTADAARRAAENLKRRGVRGVVLDLRNNPGGLLDVSVNIASLWLPNGETVLEERRGDTVIKTLRTEGKPVLNGVPTVVMINEGSASASEIIAGALNDHGAAILLGTKSFGKGSVQQLERLPSGGVLKITVARWYTPDGKNIDNEGLEPKLQVEMTEEDFQSGRDPQKDAAVEQLSRQ